MRRASESLNVFVFASAATNIPRERYVRSGPDSKPRREPASKGVRLHLPDQLKKSSEVM